MVKERGTRENAVPGPQKIAGRRSQAPHSRQWYEQVDRGPLQLTVGSQIFSELLGPQIYTLITVADILRSALCCHNNETRAPIANPPNSAQLGGTSYHSAKLHPCPCSSVGMRSRTGRHTDTQTHVTNMHCDS